MLDVRVQLLRVHRVVKRVEEWAHVRVDLRKDIAGKEAETLAGLDRRSREDDPPDLPFAQRRDGERDREVRLAGARGADAKRDRALADRVDVVLLRDGLRRDLLAAVRPDDVLEDLADVLGLVEGVEDGVDGAGADLLTALDEV